MDTPSVTAVLHQLLVRYRRGAALHVGLSTSLGLGGVGLVVWRLWLNGVSRPVLGGVAAAGLLGVAAWQWRVLRRERLNRRQLVAQLDEALGLKARLLTAVEFADAPQPPALYARLLEETTSTLPEAFRRLPPVVDRRMVALAAVLLLLWLWPRSSTRLTQLAMTSPSVMPSPSPSPEQRQDRAASSQHQTGQGGEGSQSQQAGAQSNGSQDSRGSQSAQSSPSQSTQGSQPDARQAQQQSSAQANASSGSQDQKRQSAGQQASASASEQREQSGRAGQTGQASTNAAAAKDRDAAGRESGAKQQLAKLSQAAGAQQAGSSAQQELLKADIQQLLKELSTELKQMQAELEAAQRHDQPNPAPGTSTDPNLYGDSAQATRAAGNRLPVQLEVDTQPTASTRRGGGVGKPSTDVADALPQQQPEEATLSDVRTTETGVAPQSIPPEYRPVFERLSRQ